MKNKDYVRTCSDKELAEIIAAMIINVLETVNDEVIDQIAVNAEIYAISK